MTPEYFASFNAHIHGQGNKTVVMGHGFGADQSSWEPVVARMLAAGYRVVTYDIAGTTRNTLPLYQAERHGNLFGFAEDLVALLQALEIRNASFVGHSAGGMIGILAANGEPGLFKSLSLIGSAACYIDCPESGYVGAFTRARIEAMVAAMRSDYAAWANGFAQLVVSNPDRPHLALEFSRSLRSLRPDIAVAVLTGILYADHRPDAERVSIPTQVLQTERDAAVPLAAAQWLAKAVRAVDFKVIPVEGHFPHISDPEIVANALLDFLGKQAGD